MCKLWPAERIAKMMVKTIFVFWGIYTFKVAFMYQIFFKSMSVDQLCCEDWLESIVMLL